MNRSLIVLSTALAAPCAAALTWALLSSPQSTTPSRNAVSLTQAYPESASQAERSTRNQAVSGPSRHSSKLARPSTEDFPEVVFEPRALAVASAPIRISPKFTAATQSLPALPGMIPESGARIRVLPTLNLAASSTPEAQTPDEVESSSADMTPNPNVHSPQPVVVQVDQSLHDPAAWIEGDSAMPAAKEQTRARIADQFAAEVAATATQRDATPASLEKTWNSARTRANWEYQKFFGTEAANRKGIEAARAALAK